MSEQTEKGSSIREEAYSFEQDPIRKIEEVLHDAKAETREERFNWGQACSRSQDFRNGWTMALWFEDGDIRPAVAKMRWNNRTPTPVEIRQEDPQRFTPIEDRPVLMLTGSVTVNEGKYLMPKDERTYVSKSYSERVLRGLGVLKEGESMDSLANQPREGQKGDWGPIYDSLHKTVERLPTNISGVEVSVNLDWPFGIKASFDLEALAKVIKR